MTQIALSEEMPRSPAPPGWETCAGCGCWELDPCWTEESGACWWVDDGLCAHCANPGEADPGAAINGNPP